MTPRYGRAYGKERAVIMAPYQRGHYMTMISAISINKIEAAMYGQWSGNGEIFLTFLESYLCPVLLPEHVVIMDNVRFHKIQGVYEMIKATGSELIYLPPYSPELNPIEEMWSKIKWILRKLSARTIATFQKAIKKAYESINQSDLSGWFRHAGY